METDAENATEVETDAENAKEVELDAAMLPLLQMHQQCHQL